MKIARAPGHLRYEPLAEWAADVAIAAFPGDKVAHEVYRVGQAAVDLKVAGSDDWYDGSPAGIEIRTIKVAPDLRRQGVASRALEQIANWADSTRTVMYLWADPFGDQPMSSRQLQRLYKRFGFQVLRGRTMIRIPRPAR